MVDISTFKSEFRNSYFLVIRQFHSNSCSYSLSIINTVARVTFGTVLFFRGIVVLRTVTVKRIYLKHPNFCNHNIFFSKHQLLSSIFLK